MKLRNDESSSIYHQSPLYFSLHFQPLPPPGFSIIDDTAAVKATYLYT